MEARTQPPSAATARAIARITSGLESSAMGPWLIVATRSYQLRAVSVDCPSLMVVLEGTKRIRWNGRTVACPAGTCVVLHGATMLDMENIPDTGAASPGQGRYRTWGLIFPWRVVELARALLLPHGRDDEGVSCGPMVGDAQAPAALPDLEPPERRPGLPSGVPMHSTVGLEHLVEPLELLLRGGEVEGDSSIAGAEADYRLLGVLLALVRLGHRGFLRADPILSTRVRGLVASDPGRAWQSHDIEAAFHMSGATLRRKLAAHGTSLREILRDVRLHHGLALLQTTRQPLEGVAYASGYGSVAGFSKAFRGRFGVEPAALRG